MPRAVVLIIDGLGAKHLGPYGNTWIETPAFNHLAAESLLLENVYSPFANVWKSLDAMWRGRSAVGQLVANLEDSDLLNVLSQKGVTSQLLTDDAEVLDQNLAAYFSEQVNLEAAHGVKLADEWDDTHAASFFAQSIRAVEQLRDNSLLWLQTKGLGNPWDAPYAYREQFADEEDPEPTGSAQVPSLELDADYDPDTLHEIQCACAGQVVLIDQCLGVLLSVIRELGASQQLLFVLAAPRGYPLGEHLRVGWKEPALYHELLHVPGFIRFPDGQHALRRRSGLGELCDITGLLLDWFDGKVPPLVRRVDRGYSLSHGFDELLLRTPVWQFRYPASLTGCGEDSLAAELYLKPDDQNEVNDVAGRCGHVVEAGGELIQQLMTDPPGRIEIPPSLLEPPE